MTVRWCAFVPIYGVFCVASGLLSAQTAAGPRFAKSALPPAVQPFQHHKRLVAAYDSVADSTHLSVVTHKGKYFLTWQRPRLTWSVVYAGRAPGPTAPAQVELEFRTQEPQAAADDRLLILYGADQRLEVRSAGGRSDPGVQTWSYFMRFPVSCAGLVEALGSDQVRVTVGGISERMNPDQVEALRDLLSRVGAWPGGCGETQRT